MLRPGTTAAQSSAASHGAIGPRRLDGMATENLCREYAGERMQSAYTGEFAWGGGVFTHARDQARIGLMCCAAACGRGPADPSPGLDRAAGASPVRSTRNRISMWLTH